MVSNALGVYVPKFMLLALPKVAPKSRKPLPVTVRLPNTSLTPAAVRIVPPVRLTVAVLFTWLFCEISRVAPLATATDVVPPAAELVAEFRLSKPACTSTAPVNVLLAVTTSVPVPSLVMPPMPLSVPDSVVVVLLVMS